MWKKLDSADPTSYPKQMEFVPISIYAGGVYLTRTAAVYRSNTQDMKWLGVDGRNIIGNVVAWYKVPDYSKSSTCTTEEHF